METDPITVSASTPINELVEEYFYKYHFKMYPVVDNSKLVGFINTHMVKEIPKENWKLRNVGEIARECSDENCVRPDADAMDALSKMSQSGNSRLLVLEDGELVGIITLKDMITFLSMKMDIEND